MDGISGVTIYLYCQKTKHLEVNMNRKLLILVTLLVFVSTACSQSLVKTDNTIEFEKLEEAKDWSEPFIVTSLNPKGVKVALEDGGMKFHLSSKETYVYKFLNRNDYKDVTIKAEIENAGINNNGIAFVCRANEEKTEWIEFRITNQGRYDLYHYDDELRYEYKNPYVSLLRSGKTEALYPIKNNFIQVTCEENTFSLVINDEEIFEKEIPIIEDEGGVGVGAMAFDELPVSIIYQSVNFNRP